MASMNDQKPPQDRKTPTAKTPMPQPMGKQNPSPGTPSRNPGSSDPRR